jgi:hypothetical protein
VLVLNGAAHDKDATCASIAPSTDIRDFLSTVTSLAF